MTLAEKHAYWDELLEIRRLRDRDPTTLEIGEVAVVGSEQGCHSFIICLAGSIL